MGRLLIADNPQTVNLAYTQISSAVSAGSTTLKIDNTEGFTANDYVIIGEEGTETAELIKISTVTSPNTLTLASALTFAHSVDEPVRMTTVNKIKFYGDTDSTIEAANLLATVDIAVDSPRKETLYFHTSGDDTYYYKYTYYNSTTGDETSLDDSITVSGGESSDLYCNEEEVLEQLEMSKDDSAAINTSMILRLIMARTEKINHEANTSFRTETISSSDYQYVDGRGKYKYWYFLGKAPIISITALQTTQTTPGSTATWNTLTEGRDNDFILDKEKGTVYIADTSYYPEAYPDALRWYGTWGRASVPEDVKDVIIKGVILDLARSTIYKSLIKGTTYEIANNTINEWEKDWKEIVNRYKVRRYINV